MANDVPTFVKWAGGKKQLLQQFRSLFPKKIITYIEPFLGSGAVFFYVKKHYNIKNAVLSDINEELINCFQVVRDKPESLIKLLKEHKVKHSKEFYYKMRLINPKTLSDVQRGARLIYLNKTCFNGLYRVNSKGQFNVPMGSYKNPDVVSESKIIKANMLLKSTTIKYMPFTHIESVAKAGDFIYFDPPYYPISKTSAFTTYTENGFGEKEQRELAELFKRLDRKGCLLMLSNSNSDFIISLYKGFNIKLVDAKRLINCDATKRGKIKEVVIRNYKN